MRLFVRAAESGPISAAGRSLGMSTTAAATALRDLEASLEIRLLNWTTRHARDLHDQPTGALRVIGCRCFGILHVVPALLSFRASHLKVAVNLKLTERARFAAAVGTDLVISLGRRHEKSFVAHRLVAA